MWEVEEGNSKFAGPFPETLVREILRDNNIEDREEATRLMGQVGAELSTGIDNLRAAFRAKFGGDRFQVPGILGKLPAAEKLPTSLDDAKAWFDDHFKDKREQLVWGYANGDTQSRVMWWCILNNRSHLNSADEVRFQGWIVERVVEAVGELIKEGALTRDRHPDSSIRALYEGVRSRDPQVVRAVEGVIAHRQQALIESSERLFGNAGINVTSRVASSEDPAKFSVGLRIQATDGRTLTGTLEQPIRIEGVMVRGPFTFKDDSGTRYLVPSRALTRIITEVARQGGQGAPFVPAHNLMSLQEAALTLFIEGK